MQGIVGKMEEIEVIEEVEQLAKLSEETLNDILCTLWSTRKTGLPLSDKSHFQSLLRLPSLSHLDPVLASLRSLLRKCVHHHNMARDDLLGLLPPGLPPHLQTNLVSALEKNRDRWKEDVTTLLKGTINVAPSLLWPRTQQHFHPPPPGVAAPCFPCDAVAPSDNLGDIPCLKSMTWTMDNPGSSPGDRVATISLKLHDYSKSPSGETEVKFQLTRDILEAMLRSMTYIREQLNAVETSSGPANKKQKQ